jgi:PBP1b-binding outer membrane lipoprotein LpoB
MHNQRTTLIAMLGLLLAFTLFLGGCSDVRPIDPQTPTAPTPNTETVKVTYNYKDNGNVTLSANNITLKKGQTLILEPAAGLTKKTRFLSSGENFFNNVMEQVKTDSSKLVFVAKATGKGKLQVIPNYTETDRAIDFWVTVQ